MNTKFTKLFFSILAVAFGLSVQMTAQRLVITEPASIAGEYAIGTAEFGLQIVPCGDPISISGNLESGLQADGATTACVAGGDLSDLSGLVALVDRGDCAFTEKATTAQAAGAIAVIICNNDPAGGVIGLSGDAPDVTIPAVMVSFADCATIRGEFGTATVVATLDNELDMPIDPNSDDVALWSSTFNGGLDGWSSTSVSCSGAAAEEAGWIWSSVDTWSQGAFGGGASLFSFSTCDGAVIFDSDFLDNNGNGDALGGGPCPAVNEAHLISPSIDLASLGVQGVVGLKFVNMFRQFQSDYIVGWSTDGGANWTEITVNEDAEVNSAHTNNIQRIAMADVAPDANLLLRFRMVGNYYYWGIDDVQLIEFTGVDVKMAEAFYTPFTFAVPSAHADADTFFFSTTLSNTGGEVLNDFTLSVDVTKVSDGSNTSVYSDSEVLGPLGVNETVSAALSQTWVPSNLDSGLYAINYAVDLGLDENNPDDNTQQNFFRITEGSGAYWAKDDGARFIRDGNGAPYKLANTYITSDNAGAADLAVEGITVSLGASNDDSAFLTDNFVEVFLVRLNDDINPFDPAGTGFDIDQVDVASNASYEIIAETTHVFTDEANFAETTIFFNPDSSSIELEPASGYMAIIGFSSAQAGAATQRNQDILYAYDERVDASGAAIIFDEEDSFGNAAQWFLGGFGDGTFLRLNYLLDTSSDTDDIPLPEGTFTAYPNPATDYINAVIDFDEPTSGTMFFATMEGKIISMKEFNNVTTANEVLTTSNLPSGVYIVRLSTEIGSKTYKVAVQH